jgi:hypothetical protein
MTDRKPLIPLPPYAEDILDSLFYKIDNAVSEAEKYDRDIDVTWVVRDAVGRACAEAFTAGYVTASKDNARERNHRADLAKQREEPDDRPVRAPNVAAEHRVGDVDGDVFGAANVRAS